MDKSAKTNCFAIANFWPRVWKTFLDFCAKTEHAIALAASAPLPAVARSHIVCVCVSVYSPL